ncbi:MAG: hypothetical protein WCE69_13845 [Aestuariivirga sp.]
MRIGLGLEDQLLAGASAEKGKQAKECRNENIDEAWPLGGRDEFFVVAHIGWPERAGPVAVRLECLAIEMYRPSRRRLVHKVQHVIGG